MNANQSVYESVDVFIIVSIIALGVAVVLLLIKQWAMPIPVSENYISSMDRRIAQLENTVDELRGIVAQKDVTISEQIATISWYKAHYGHIDIITNNQMTIPQLIAQNKVHEALQKALDTFKDNRSLDTVILLQGKYVRANTYKSKGLQTPEEHEMTIGRIGDALLELCKD